MHSTLVAVGALALALPFQQVNTAPPDVLAALAPAAQAGAGQTVEPVLPLPHSPLAIGAGRSNLADLVGQISELTGVSIRASGPALGRLSESPSGLLADVAVTPEHAWSFFEGLIAQEGFMLVELRSSEPRLMAIVDSYDGNRSFGARSYRAIDSSDLDRYADHHALLIETVLHFDHVDVRQLTNSMRALTGDGSSLNMVPAGSSGSLVIQGTGANVFEMSRMLEAIEEAERARFAGIGAQGETGSSDGTAGG